MTRLTYDLPVGLLGRMWWQVEKGQGGHSEPLGGPVACELACHTKGRRALCRTPQSRPSLTPAPSRRGLSSTDFPLGARSLPPSRDPSVLCSLPQRGTWDSKEGHRPSLLPPVRRKKVLIRSFPPFASLTCSFLHSPESFGQMFEARCWPGHWGQRGAMSLLSGCWGRQARRWISQGSLVGVGTTEKVCRGAAQG